MNVLDSNVEALAFNYLSLGLLTALNNLWTWIALLTAALSFWKIRSAGCPKPKPEAQAQPFVKSETFADLLTVEKTVSSSPFSPPLLCGENKGEENGQRKGKFTVYYEEEDTDMQCTCDENEGLLTAWEEKEGTETEWWKRWERLLQLRNGESENGWYTWQDLTELNGSIVRTWGGGLSGRFDRESWYNNYNSSCMHVW